MIYLGANAEIEHELHKKKKEKNIYDCIFSRYFVPILTYTIVSVRFLNIN